MAPSFFNSKKIKQLFIPLGIIFVLTEFLDVLLDTLFGNSLLHSLLQLLLFMALFMITYSLIVRYEEKKVKQLIPEELMNILRIIHHSKQKGVIINHRAMRETLSVTKPTLKKRIDTLTSLEYITCEEKGNHKYFYLTRKGESALVL